MDDDFSEWTRLHILEEYADAAYQVMPGGPDVTDEMWRRYVEAVEKYERIRNYESN